LPKTTPELAAEGGLMQMLASRARQKLDAIVGLIMLGPTTDAADALLQRAARDLLPTSTKPNLEELRKRENDRSSFAWLCPMQRNEQSDDATSRPGTDHNAHPHEWLGACKQSHRPPQP
jgi:hypothetical protein